MSDTYRLHYTSADEPGDDAPWSVYVEEYETPESDEPIDGSGQWLCSMDSEAQADRLANALQAGRVTPAPCGCVPHETRMTQWGFHCVTEDQGYCNFECPHDDEDEDDHA